MSPHERKQTLLQMGRDRLGATPEQKMMRMGSTIYTHRAIARAHEHRTKSGKFETRHGFATAPKKRLQNIDDDSLIDLNNVLWPGFWLGIAYGTTYMANEDGQYTDCYEATELLILGTDRVWEENRITRFVDLFIPTMWDEMAMSFWDLSFLGSNFMFKCRYPNWIKEAQYLMTLEGVERFGVRMIFASFTSIPKIVYS